MVRFISKRKLYLDDFKQNIVEQKHKGWSQIKRKLLGKLVFQVKRNHSLSNSFYKLSELLSQFIKFDETEFIVFFSLPQFPE